MDHTEVPGWCIKLNIRVSGQRLRSFLLVVAATGVSGVIRHIIDTALSTIEGFDVGELGRFEAEDKHDQLYTKPDRAPPPYLPPSL